MCVCMHVYTVINYLYAFEIFYCKMKSDYINKFRTQEAMFKMLFLLQNFDYGYPTHAKRYYLAPLIAKYFNVEMYHVHLEF
jgi:hypothetical protein